MADVSNLCADFETHHIDGIAREGMTPFSAPLISRIDDTLWQGGCINGVSLGGRFKHVISLYPWERYRIDDKVESFTEVKLYDGPVVPDEEQLYHLARWINMCRKHGTTLVHCQAGLNRSALLAGLALVLEGNDPDDVITQLRASRCPAVLCNKKFEGWLRNQTKTVAR